LGFRVALKALLFDIAVYGFIKFDYSKEILCGGGERFAAASSTVPFFAFFRRIRTRMACGRRLVLSEASNLARLLLLCTKSANYIYLRK